MNRKEKIFISKYAQTTSRKKLITEKMIKYFFMINSLAAIFLILSIFIFLLYESYRAFEQIGIGEFFSKTITTSDGVTKTLYQWYPTSEEPRYSLISLLVGSLLTALPATIISAIFGIAVGIYLSEISNSRFREILKPIIEIFAGIPTVVIGFIMLVIGATIFHDLFHPPNRLNAFLASIGLSMICIPIIASLTEEALRSVPNELRMASYSLGANKWQTIKKVILPAAVSGLSAAIILGFGRAIGETMIVLMASGNAADLTFNLFRSMRSMTATIAAEMGEVSFESNHYYALFVIGMVLFVFTFILNLIAELILNKMRKKLQS